MNCKPGDMAISVNTEYVQNLGIVVQVLRRHVDSRVWDMRGEPSWWCRSTQLLSWYFGSRKVWVFDYEGPIPDRCLRPIRPPASHKGEQASEPSGERQAMLA